MAVFNQENGQLALGTKTPVSILQELLQKKGATPHYELIYNGVGTPDPRFKFRVSAEGETAIGDGKTKKEAKHDAAATLLKRLLGSKGEEGAAEAVEEVEIASPYTGALKTNYVGCLDEICFLNKIPIPNYVLVREEGPPHARVFTMKCNISSIHEIAVARTKKQAKHLVAQKMIERVKKILKDGFISALEGSEAPEEVVSDQEKILNGSFQHDMTYRVQDLHNVFHIQKEELPLPSVFLELPEKPENYYDSLKNPNDYLKEVVEALGGAVKKNDVTREEFVKSLNVLMESFEENENGQEDDEEFDNEEINQCEFSTSNDVNKYYLPDFPLDDEDFYLTPSKQEDAGCVSEMANLKISDSSFFSCIKVEVPRGCWDFIGFGSSEEEALNEAARRALKFLRIMAIPPPENFL